MSNQKGINNRLGQVRWYPLLSCRGQKKLIACRRQKIFIQSLFSHLRLWLVKKSVLFVFERFGKSDQSAVSSELLHM